MKMLCFEGKTDETSKGIIRQRAKEGNRIH